MRFTHLACLTLALLPAASSAAVRSDESSDDIGSSCAPSVKRSPALATFREIRLDTGLGHGMLHRPLPQWVRPTIASAKR